MAHQIDTSVNANGAFVSNRLPAWHGLGEVLDGLDLSQVLDPKRGINYKVELYPSGANVDGKFIRSKDEWATVRTDTMTVLRSGLGDRYEVVQHVDEMRLFDEVFTANGFGYETAGVLNGGREVFVLVTNPESFVAAPGDVLKRHLLLNFSYDGGSKTRVKGVDTRVVCKNTQRIALREDGGLDYGIIHTSSASDKLEDIRKVLASSAKAFEQHEREVKYLVNEYPSREGTILAMQAAIMAAFGPEPARTEIKKASAYQDKVEEMQHEIKGLLVSPNQTVGGIAGTSWSLYNAISEWADHVYAAGVRGDDRRKAENRFLSIVGGRANEVKRAAWTTLLPKELLAA